MESCTPEQALVAAIEAVGSQAAMARLVGLTQPAVCGWVRKAGRLPAEHVLAVEAATGISRHALRPDIYPLEERSDHPERSRPQAEQSKDPREDAPAQPPAGNSPSPAGGIAASDCDGLEGLAA